MGVLGKAIRVAVAGLGTVGGGVIKLLRENEALLTSRAGQAFQVVAVSARDRQKDRGVDLSGLAWFEDPVVMAREAEAELFVELIGGSEGPAKMAVEAALAAGKDVVTANKALVAHHGAALARQAAASGRTLAYEAAVAGGIPIIKTLREGMAANQVSQVYGILNGTCNYVLSTMRDSGREFAEVLAEAQGAGLRRGRPELRCGRHRRGPQAGDPGVPGVRLASSTSRAVHVEGIRSRFRRFDIAYAEELGYRIKLLGLARLSRRAGPGAAGPPLHGAQTSAPIAACRWGDFNAVVADGELRRLGFSLGRARVPAPGRPPRRWSPT